MNKSKREFLVLFGLSYLSVHLLPYKLLYSATKKIINPNLTKEQKKRVKQILVITKDMSSLRVKGYKYKEIFSVALW